MSSYIVKDSGERREFGTGAVRDMGGGKGRMDLLPFFALLELAKHFEAGAVKYGAENWRKGIPLRVYLDSAIRHLFKFALGMRDERHDLAALWNVACLIETQHMVDRGILPATLADLPNFFNADDGGDAYPPDWHAHKVPAPGADPMADVNLTADEIAGMPLAGALPGAYGCDDVPAVGEDVMGLDDWLGERFPEDPNAPEPFTDKGDPIPVKVRRSLNLGDYPVDLRPQDRHEYTRGHADETAARFNAGLPYANADAVLADAAGIIADHPLFQVGIIDGPDAAEYDEPGADPLADKAWVIVERVGGSPPSQWFLGSDGTVAFKYGPGYPCEPSRVHTRDSIRQGILAGRLRVIEAGLAE